MTVIPDFVGQTSPNDTFGSRFFSGESDLISNRDLAATLRTDADCLSAPTTQNDRSVNCVGEPENILSEARPSAEAQAFHDHAEALADWSVDRLIHRSDACGGYWKDGPFTCKKGLRRARLLAHFRATKREDVIGCHSGSKGPDSTAKWIAADVDAHGNETDDPAANWQRALYWLEKAKELGFSVLLTDSNGAGGLHFWILFSQAIPLEVAHEFANWFFSTEEGEIVCEVFPKQSSLTAEGDGSFGNWLRLPGRHYKRDHWTRVWNGEDWLAGVGAVKAILESQANDPSPILSWFAAHDAARKVEQEAREKAFAESQQAKAEANGHAWHPADETQRHRKYGQACLQNACKKVSQARANFLHFTVRDAAFSLGHYVKNYYLSESDIQSSLEHAANAAGAKDMKRASKTIASGIEKGKQKPQECLPSLPRMSLTGKRIDGDTEQTGRATVGSSNESPEKQEWNPPVPFGRAASVPIFPVEIFPAWLREFVVATATATQTPICAPAMLALATISGGFGGKIRFRIRQGWYKNANLYIVDTDPKKRASFDRRMRAI